MLIVGTLMIMLVITMFSFIIGTDFTDSLISGTVETTGTVNGTATEFITEGTDLVFGIDATTGIIAGIVAISVIAGVVGIQVLGSGLSDTSVRVITMASAYGGLWTILSVISAPLIFEIEVFGAVIYISLTILYVLGVFQKFTGGSE